MIIYWSIITRRTGLNLTPRFSQLQMHLSPWKSSQLAPEQVHCAEPAALIFFEEAAHKVHHAGITQSAMCCRQPDNCRVHGDNKSTIIATCLSLAAAKSAMLPIHRIASQDHAVDHECFVEAMQHQQQQKKSSSNYN